MNNYLLNIPKILLLGIVFMFACEDSGEEQPDLSTIEYTLTSQEAGKFADIEYTSIWGMVVKLEDEPLPWSTSFKAIFELGDALSFHAESGEEGDMTAQIIMDDTVVARGKAVYLIQLEYINGLK
jgi:hypothetical protein